MSITMDDKQLAKWLGIAGTKDEAAILARVTPEKRREYEEFAEWEAQVILYDQGLGPLPANTIACGRKQIRHSKGNEK